MEDNEKQKNLSSNWIVKNLLLAFAFFAVLLIAATVLLNIVTKHGEAVEVPDLTNMSVNEAKHAAANVDLKVDVVDSVFARKMAKGAVYSQNPKAGSLVKKGRKIHLTTNTMRAKKIRMPRLVEMNVVDAKAKLKASGLVLGKLIYVNGQYTNWVTRQLYNNREISAGKQIESGSTIDLEVCLNSEECQTNVPDVKGMKCQRAIDAVHDSYLNVRKLVFDNSVKTYKDSLDAVVYKQSPNPSKAPILMGSDVSLYLSLDKKDADSE